MVKITDKSKLQSKVQIKSFLNKVFSFYLVNLRLLFEHRCQVTSIYKSYN